jgi:hypothetical protein
LTHTEQPAPGDGLGPPVQIVTILTGEIGQRCQDSRSEAGLVVDAVKGLRIGAKAAPKEGRFNLGGTQAGQFSLGQLSESLGDLGKVGSGFLVDKHKPSAWS